MAIDRYIHMFEFICNKRICPLLEYQIENLFNDDKYFTHYYKDQLVNGEYITRPILNLTDLALPILCLIVDETNSEEFINTFRTDILKMDPIVFFSWLSTYCLDSYILFEIPDKNGNIMTFWATIYFDLKALVREGYEYIFGDK